MHRAGVCWVFLSLFCFSLTCSAESSAAAAPPELIQRFSSLPLGFEQNRGQAAGDVLFLSRAAGYTVCLLRDELRLVFDSTAQPDASPEVVRIRVVNAEQNTKAKGVEDLPGVINYYIGNDPAQWRTGLRHYGQVRYTNLYPGIDLVFYGNRQQLEFDFDVARGARPSRIILKLEGAAVRKLRNNLQLVTPSGKASLLKQPQLYQVAAHGKSRVHGGYVVRQDEIAIRVGRYDKNKALVICP